MSIPRQTHDVVVMRRHCLGNQAKVLKRQVIEKNKKYLYVGVDFSLTTTYRYLSIFFFGTLPEPQGAGLPLVYSYPPHCL